MAEDQQTRRTLILTGASRGIGHATVKRFSSAGWRVITCSRQPFPEDCPWEAGPEDHIQIDLADPANVLEGISVMRERLQDQGSRLGCRPVCQMARRLRSGGQAETCQGLLDALCPHATEQC